MFCKTCLLFSRKATAVYEWESLLVGLQYFSSLQTSLFIMDYEMELIPHGMLILFLLFEQRATMKTTFLEFVSQSLKWRGYRTL